MTGMAELIALLRLRLAVAIARAGRFLRRRIDPVALEPADRFRAAAERPPVGPVAPPEAWPEPVEGVDYALSDIDDELRASLAATGRELAGRVPSRYGRRRRRRRAGLLAGVAALVLVGGGAAATALLDSSSGLPLVDRSIERSTRDRPDEGSRPDPSPAARPSSPVLSIPSGVPGEPGRISVYVSAAGDVCAGYEAGAGGPGAGLTCKPGALARTALGEHGITVTSITFGAKTVIAGLVAEGAELLGAHGPDGPMEVRSSRPWRTAEGDLPTVRVIAAFSPSGEGTHANPTADSRTALDRYRLLVGRPTGETFELRPWGEPRIVTQP
ncbi:MAG: hypothetical protein GXY03_11940 [Solirubrobacterales bacterium]|nr:hypothetical protein [Solirubrobacterales bacterium]